MVGGIAQIMVDNIQSLTLAELAKNLEDPSEERLVDIVIEKLAELENVEFSIIKRLLKILEARKEDPVISRKILKALIQANNADPLVIISLLKLLKSRVSDATKCIALEALGELKNSANQVIEILLKFLKDEYDWLRRISALSLGKLGKPKPFIITALLFALEDKSEWVVEAAVEALGMLGSANELIIAALLKKLKDDGSTLVRSTIIKTLGELGNINNVEIIEALSAMLEDKCEWIKQVAEVSLKKLNSKREILIASVKNDHKRKHEVLTYETMAKENFKEKQAPSYNGGNLKQHNVLMFSAFIPKHQDFNKEQDSLSARPPACTLKDTVCETKKNNQVID